jgi:O-antigen/teichoic acid export membrane protein
MTIVGFLSVFNALGLPQSAVRFVAAYSATAKVKLLGGFLARSVVVLLVSNLVLGGILIATGRWIAVHLYHTPALATYMGLFALIMVFGTMNVFFGQVLAGYKDVAKRTLITNFIGTPAMMILTIVLVTWGFGLWGYISAQAAAAALTTAMLMAVAWRLTPKEARVPSVWHAGFEREVVSFSLAAFGMVLLQFLMGQADKILIGFYLNAREVGIYAVGMGLVAFVPSVLQAVSQIFAPTISELHARGDRLLLGRIFQTLTKWVLGLTIPLIMMLLLFARPMMRIFGADFEMGWPVLVIGTLGELIDCGVGSVGFLLMMSGNERRLLRIQMVMVAGIVALNFLLIPRWGIVGAAFASASTNIITNLWCLKVVHDSLGLFPYSRSYYRLLAPVAGSFAVLWLARSAFTAYRPMLVMGGSLIAAYVVFGAIALVVGLDSDDRLIADAVWARLRAAVPGAR